MRLPIDFFQQPLRFSLFLLFILFIHTTTQAQYVVSTSFGVNKPTFNYSDLKAGFSWSLSGNYKINEQFSAGLNLGYSASKLKTNSDARVRILPIAITANYGITYGKFRPYAGADLGVYFTKTSTPTTTLTPGGWATAPVITFEIIDTKKARFGVAPLLGLDYFIVNNIFATLLLKYNYLVSDPTYSSFSAQIGASYLIGHYIPAKRGKKRK